MVDYDEYGERFNTFLHFIINEVFSFFWPLGQTGPTDTILVPAKKG